MPITPTYPGVYVEEIPSGVRTITGVATSVTAFVGYFTRGILNEPIQIMNMGDFDRELAGLNSHSEAGYAIQQFYQNGGTQAWVVRTAGGNVAAASVNICSAIDGADALTVEAGRLDPTRYPTFTNPGVWGNNLRVSIDYPTPASDDRFNMTVSLVETRDGRQVVLDSEVFRGLSMDSNDSSFVQTVVNDRFSGSKYVRVTASGSTRPLQTGTVSGILEPFPTLTAASPELTVTIGTDGTGTATLTQAPTTLQEARQLLESAIRAARPELRAFSQATVSIVDNRLRVLAGSTESNPRVSFGTTTGDADTASGLGLSTGTNFEGLLSGSVSGIPAGGELQVTIGRSGPVTLTLAATADLEEARDTLEDAIRGASGDDSVRDADVDAFDNARVTLYDSNRLVVLPGLPGTSISFSETDSDEDTVSNLGLDGTAAMPVNAFVSDDLAAVPSIAANSEVSLTIGNLVADTVTMPNDVSTMQNIATDLETAIQAANTDSFAFTDARVAYREVTAEVTENLLIVIPGVTGDAVVFSGTTTDATSASELLLDGAAESNVQSYALGGGSAIPHTAQGTGTPGNDGEPPGSQEIIGDFGSKTGIYALEDVDIFNILCIPRAAIVDGDNALTAAASAAIVQAAINYCEQKRAFFIMDTPSNINDFQEVREWYDSGAMPNHQNAALYFPRTHIPDPLNEYRLRSIGACGTMAGIYARTDSSRGVWKAPAGIEATLRNVQRLDYTLTDSENGVLNPLAISCLRNFRVYGNVSWGARTLAGADQMASEWKYIPVRRLALYIEESLYRGTQWVVFEPNDEPLWSQIRLNVGAFMHNLFRQGAFQGSTPRDAYLVKCDSETTTQNDINLGIVNILVGFAPLKPAEFVIIKIQQLAGQIEA